MLRKKIQTSWRQPYVHVSLLPEAYTKFVIENGRFSDLFLFERLPIDLINSDKRMLKEHIETYSSGYCSGFPPDSLSEFLLRNSSPLNRRQKYIFLEYGCAGKK